MIPVFPPDGGYSGEACSAVVCDGEVVGHTPLGSEGTAG